MLQVLVSDTGVYRRRLLWNRIQPYSTKFKYGAAPRRRRRAIYFKTNISAEHSNQRLKNACVLGNAFCAYTVSEIRGDPSRNMKIGMAP